MSESTGEVKDKVCPAVAFQKTSVCVPVTVTPFARAKETTTKCCGAPVVTIGKNTCGGTKNGQCVFTITQDICIEVPVEFGAVADVGDTFVTCIGASEEDICSDCHSE